MIKIGEKFQLYCVRDGYFGLDGGAMNGIMPRPFWEKKNSADGKHRIPLSLNCLLIKDMETEQNILIDTGLGPDIANRTKYIDLRTFLDFNKSHLLEKLSQLGIHPDQIHYVILTHLHFDHSGGAVYFDEVEQEYKLTFRNAVYIIQSGELYAALRSKNTRMRDSYLRDAARFLYGCRKKNVRLIPRKIKEEKIVEGITAIRTGCHTKYHQIVKIESRGKTAVYWGDLIPTTAHLLWQRCIMAYDSYPDLTFKKKGELLNEAYNGGWLSIFEHDPKVPAGYLRKEEDKDGQKKWAIEVVEPIA